MMAKGKKKKKPTKVVIVIVALYALWLRSHQRYYHKTEMLRGPSVHKRLKFWRSKLETSLAGRIWLVLNAYYTFFQPFRSCWYTSTMGSFWKTTFSCPHRHTLPTTVLLTEENWTPVWYQSVGYHCLRGRTYSLTVFLFFRTSLKLLLRLHISCHPWHPLRNRCCNLTTLYVSVDRTGVIHLSYRCHPQQFGGGFPAKHDVIYTAQMM